MSVVARKISMQLFSSKMQIVREIGKKVISLTVGSLEQGKRMEERNRGYFNVNVQSWLFTESQRKM